MSEAATPKFHNSMGVKAIAIGVREFECIGAMPPFDHPHIYIDMGGDDDAICPYCSTHYRHDTSLANDEAIPPEAKAG